MKRIISFLFLFLTGFVAMARAQAFVHPGLLQSREDLDRMKQEVAEKKEPLYSGFEIFRQHPQSQSGYKMQGPLAMVGRNPTVGQGAYDADANAAYQNALMWCITGDTAYAHTAKEIVNAWSSTLKSITGRDAVLMAGLGPFKMVNAAELLRYTNAHWSEAEVKQTEKHFKEVVYPVINDFAPFANGNWDAAAIKTVMAIGIFCNDRNIFESGLRYYVNGAGDGRLTFYIINEEGQCQESGRDQQHTQLGIAHLGDCCEMAWHQGLNLYGYADNLLLKGFEYTAKYNLGFEVPFVPTIDRTGKYVHHKISEEGRGRLRPVYEQIYNHYVNRMGIAAPYTQQAAEKIRPEIQGQPGADHPGFGTLLYTRSASGGNFKTTARPAPPGAVIAGASSSQIQLNWVASVTAGSYTVKRAAKSGGPFTVLAKNITQSHYTDKTVQAGTLYFYTVSACNAKGESKNACATGISAGLPKPWNHQDVGNVPFAGTTSFNGQQFIMDGSGLGIDSTNDQFQFAYVPLEGEGSITVRYVPQVSSQISKMGLMMREALTPDAPHVSLIIYPGKTGQIEAPNWQARLLWRNRTSAATEVNAPAASLPEPAVTYGRLTGYCWLRLERKGSTFTGYTSLDGKSWKEIGSASAPLKDKLYVGLAVCSGLSSISTTVQFDHISVPGWRSALAAHKATTKQQ